GAPRRNPPDQSGAGIPQNSEPRRDDQARPHLFFISKDQAGGFAPESFSGRLRRRAARGSIVFKSHPSAGTTRAHSDCALPVPCKAISFCCLRLGEPYGSDFRQSCRIAGWDHVATSATLAISLPCEAFD